MWKSRDRDSNFKDANDIPVMCYRLFQKFLEFVKEMPKPATKSEIDFSSLLGPLFFMWVIELLFPVILSSLVYEKQNNQRIMMKMHGLADGPYWMITYGYFLALSVIYMVCFVGFGSAIGLTFSGRMITTYSLYSISST